MINNNKKQNSYIKHYTNKLLLILATFFILLGVANAGTISDSSGVLTYDSVNICMADGSTQFTGNVNFGGNEINNISKINSVYHVSDVSEFQTTINTALSNGGGLIQLAKGDYYLSEEIVNNCSYPLDIEGSGSKTTLYINHTGNGLIIGNNYEETENCGVSNIYFKGFDSDYGSSFNSSTSLLLLNLAYGNFNNLRGTNGLNIIEIFANNSGNRAGVNFFTNTYLDRAIGNCIYIHNNNGNDSSNWNNGNVFVNGYIQHCGTDIKLEKGTTGSNGDVSSNSFTNMYIETAYTSDILINMIDSDKNTFIGSYLDGTHNEQILLDSNSNYNMIDSSTIDAIIIDNGTSNFIKKRNSITSIIEYDNQLKINNMGNKKYLEILSNATTERALNIYSNTAFTGTRLNYITLDNPNSTGTVSEIKNDGSGTSLVLDQNGDGKSLYINSDASTQPSIAINQILDHNTFSFEILHDTVKKFGIRKDTDVDVDSVIYMGNGYMWIDATGDLRISSTNPSSDTDGVVVGSQS